jgi:CTP:molybdopterin cytidylyltransferase MocA
MNGLPPSGLRVIVLAAGFSHRLGQPKALVRVHGLSLLQRTLKLAASLNAARISIVVPRNAARYRVEARSSAPRSSNARGREISFVVNLQRARGLSSSVRRGICAARYSRAVLFLPVDLNNLKERELTRLISRWRATPRCVIARRIGERGATPLLLPRRFFARARRIGGDVGLRELINQLPPHARVLIDMPSAASDIDTPQDLKRARQNFRSRS